MWPDVQEPPECVIQGKTLFSGAQLSHLQNGVFHERLYSLSLASIVPHEEKPILLFSQS